MHYLFLFIFSFATCLFCWGQHLQVLQMPHNPDSSFYDILRIDGNEFWAAGENGTLVRMDSNGHAANIDYPSLGVDILKMERLNPEELILVGKAGVIYFHNLQSGKWKVQQVEGFDKKVFYEMAVLDEQTFLLVGGMSKIADSKTTLPRGFILMTEDKGQTWEKVYSNPLAMIWDVDVVGDHLEALMFNPFSRKRLLRSTDGKTWEPFDAKYKGLYHDRNDHNGALAGGEQMNMKGAATLVRKNEKLRVPDTPFWWSSLAVGNNRIATGSKGKLLVQGGSTQLLEAPFSTPLYEGAAISPSSALVVGHGQSILKITLNGRDLVLNR